MFQLRKLVPFLFFLFALQGHAEVLVLNQTVQRSRVSLVGEFSQLTVEGQAIQGQGLALQYDYGFSDRLILEGFISTSLSNEGGGMQSSFTGFGGYALYALLGNCCRVDQQLMLNSKSVYTEKATNSAMLLVGGGVDQLLLNGSRGIYSSSGLGVQASYLFPIWSYFGRVNAKYSTLTSGTHAVTAMFLGAGVVFAF